MTADRHVPRIGLAFIGGVSEVKGKQSFDLNHWTTLEVQNPNGQLDVRNIYPIFIELQSTALAFASTPDGRQVAKL